ncbi:MAG TPA: metal-dependent hydrolase [Bacteroidetes bacterium]|nr:metal-dependent hydrolase [Bacteroidota bacterium]
MEINGNSILFDPFISQNPKAGGIDIDSIKTDYILLSHGHADHVLDAERIAKNSGAIIISNYEIVSWYENKGIKGHPLNHGGQWHFDFGTVKYVHAVHSSVLPDGTYGGNPGGFIIWNDETCFYFAGDTALSWDMKLIPITCPELDFAILPIGDNFTMGYNDAAIAAEYVECDTIIACHFDTFGYIEINHAAAKEAFLKRGKNLIIPTIGQKVGGLKK